MTTKPGKLFALQQKQLKTIRKCYENIKSWLGLDVNDGPVPSRIMDDFDYAEDKVLIFSACRMIPLEKIGAAVERKLQPFLPDSCDHRGLFLCAGQAPENMIDNLETQFKTHSNNAEIKSIFGNCQKTIGHSSEWFLFGLNNTGPCCDFVQHTVDFRQRLNILGTLRSQFGIVFGRQDRSPHQSMYSLPKLEFTARIGLLQFLDGTVLCLYHGRLLHHVVHTDFFQRSLFESEYAVTLAENIRILLRQSVKHLPGQLDADLSIYDLFRRSRELPMYRS